MERSKKRIFLSSRALKRALLFFVLFISSLSLYASWYIKPSFIYRESTMTKVPYVISLEGGWNDLSITLSLQGLDEELNGSVKYDYRVGKTLHNEFRLHSEYFIKDRGGYSDLSYEFHQRFTWKYGGLGYRVGIMASLAYSSFSKDISWGLSPLLGLEGFLTFGPVLIEAYLRMNSDNEINWRAVPVAGLALEGTITEHQSISLEAYLKTAEYLMDPWYMVTSWAVKASYCYRGL